MGLYYFLLFFYSFQSENIVLLKPLSPTKRFSTYVCAYYY